MRVTEIRFRHLVAVGVTSAIGGALLAGAAKNAEPSTIQSCTISDNGTQARCPDGILVRIGGKAVKVSGKGFNKSAERNPDGAAVASIPGTNRDVLITRPPGGTVVVNLVQLHK